MSIYILYIGDYSNMMIYPIINHISSSVSDFRTPHTLFIRLYTFHRIRDPILSLL